MNRYIFILLAALLLGSASFAYGHGFGRIYSTTVGDYFIDVDYEAPDVYASIPGRFSFNLKDKNGQEAEFGDVWVRFMEGNKVIFASALARPEFGLAGATIEFSRAGKYELFVRFELGDDSLAEAVFPIDVIAGDLQAQDGASGGRDPLIAGVLGFILGVGGAYAFWGRKGKLKT